MDHAPKHASKRLPVVRSHSLDEGSDRKKNLELLSRSDH